MFWAAPCVTISVTPTVCLPLLITLSCSGQTLRKTLVQQPTEPFSPLNSHEKKLYEKEGKSQQQLYLYANHPCLLIMVWISPEIRCGKRIKCSMLVREDDRCIVS